MKQKFGIFLALALMLAFAGCQFDAPVINGNTPEVGYGLLKLSINGSSARTIMPPALSGDDATYTITFVPEDGQTEPTGDFEDLALSEIDGLEVELELGEWEITVTAFFENKAIAEDTLSVTIEDVQTLDFTLDPFTVVNGEGTFTWTITTDADVNVTVEVDGIGVVTDEEDLPVGNYIVTVTLTKDGDTAIIEYILQIYNNMTSHFTGDFTGYNFASGKLNPPYGAAWPYDDEEEIIFEEDITLNIKFPLSTGSLGGLAGTFSWKEDGDEPIVANEGDDPLEAIMVFEPSDTINYNTVEKTIEITVLKADITGSYDDGGVTLTGDEGDLLSTVIITATKYGDFDGTYAWDDGDTVLDEAVTLYDAIFTPDAKYNANYNVADIPVQITVDVTAVTPIEASDLTITGQAAADPNEGIDGDEITLTGTAVKEDTDCQGVITYQWFKNYDDATTGGTAITIAAASGTALYTLTEDDADEGTVYFYFIATNTLEDNGVDKIKTVTSATVAVTVEAKLFKVSLEGPAGSETEYEFASLIEGYASTDNVDTVTVTLANEGNQATGTLTFGFDGDNAFEFVTAPSTASIAVDGSINIEIKVQEGLDPGNHTATLEVSGVDFATVTYDLSVEIEAELFAVSLTGPAGYETEFTFASLTEGYEPTENEQTVTVILANEGNKETGTLTIELVDVDNAFEFVTTPSDASIAVDGSISIEIKVQDGLDEGVYSATLEVSGDDFATVTYDLEVEIES